GKNLEYVAQNQGVEDLYLLQQLAELQLPGKHQLYFLGLLHQSFGGYSDRLAATEQQEWNKIQGRFENLSLTEAPSQMLRVLSEAIHCTDPKLIPTTLEPWAAPWVAALPEALAEVTFRPGQDLVLLCKTYPLHPVTTLVLPRLCTRYAQHDRSLFTFLTSPEPLALPAFLNTHSLLDRPLPTLKLHQLYDYFMDSMAGLASRVNLQRWLEVQSLIEDAQGQSATVLQILKTVGLLNLIATTGPLRATPQLVALALCDQPESEALERWTVQIQELQERGVLTYRRQGDELRLWEGSDFDIEAAVTEQLEQQRQPLADLMTELYPLQPIVAQRHYAQTGTLRYFGRQYGDSRLDWSKVFCNSENTLERRGESSQDGLILYWLDRTPVSQPPAFTADGYPLVVIQVPFLDLLQTRVRQVQALATVQKTSSTLKQDGVARREVRHCLEEAQRFLEETLAQCLTWRRLRGRQMENFPALQFWSLGERSQIQSVHGFQRLLSNLCDRVYDRGIILDNELINRRELTSQGAKARKQVLEALLLRPEQFQLGLTGYGPEVTIYGSVLALSGIHRIEADQWGIYPPLSGGKVQSKTLWDAIEDFCFGAQEETRSLADLVEQLAQPPYGIKAGVIPIVLVAVLLYHRDTIGLYETQQFIPQLGMEHVERLLKSPQSFAVKSFILGGIRAQLFEVLEQVLALPHRATPPTLRNVPLLRVAKPLFSFVRKLPDYTHQTQSLSTTARSVLATLQQAQEPDILLFSALPIACGFPALAQACSLSPSLAFGATGEFKTPEVIAPQVTEPQVTEPQVTNNIALEVEAFRDTLVASLQALQGAYGQLLQTCQARIAEVFGISETKLAITLASRCQPLLESCTEPVLRRFLKVVVEGLGTDRRAGGDPDRSADSATPGQRSWLESVVMVVADKPAPTWKDSDFKRFETQLLDLSRRLANLEAIQQVEQLGRSPQTQGQVRRITLTQSNGEEVNRVVWLDPGEEAGLDQLIQQVLSQDLLQDKPHLREALLVRLSETVLMPSSAPPNPPGVSLSQTPQSATLQTSTQLPQLPQPAQASKPSKPPKRRTRRRSSAP
ncbi:MAG: hypothetical protein VKK80_15750, partial [Prochlorothrix sp.]|nr:hypothetical protein [Prochlorothrix sp.]